MRHKFGALYDWEKPEFGETVGPFYPEAFDDFECSLHNLLRECFVHLKTYPDNSLPNINVPMYIRGNEEVNEWQAFAHDQFDQLKRKQPHWTLGGFGHPDKVCDFEYWARMPRLHLHEAVSLTVGVEPEYLEELLKEEESLLETISNPLVFAKRRAEQFTRQFTLGQNIRSIQTDKLLDWINAVSLAVHTEALKHLERFHGKRGKLTAPHARPDARELDSVTTLFTAMAIEQFGYDPTAKRSPTVKEIQDLAASLGITMSDDTIRHYLRRGAKFIDPEWKPHSR